MKRKSNRYYIYKVLGNLLAGHFLHKKDDIKQQLV